MKTSMILAGAALLATGGMAAAQSAGGAGGGAGGSAGGMSGSAGAGTSGSMGGSSMGGSTMGGSTMPGTTSGTTLGTGTSQRGMGRPNASVTTPGTTTGVNGASDAATTAGRPSPTTQAPIGTGSDALQPDSPASGAPVPPTGGSTPN